MKRLLASRLHLEPHEVKAFTRWLGIGLVIRLMIMPFTVQSDMFAVYRRSAYIAFEGNVFSDYMVNMGAHWVHAAWLIISAPFMPEASTLWKDPWWWAQAESLVPQFMQEILARPDLYWILSVLKFPYFITDMTAGILLFVMGSKVASSRRMAAWAFWMLSPIGLYASYAFGRYEMFAVVFVVGALMAFESEHYMRAALLLGVGVTMRSYPLLLIPIFAMFVPLGWWIPRRVRTAFSEKKAGARGHGDGDQDETATYRLTAPYGTTMVARIVVQIGWMLLALVPFGLVMVANKLVGGTVGEIATLSQYHTGSTFFAYAIPVNDNANIYLFFVFAMVFYLIIFLRSHSMIGTGLGGVGAGSSSFLPVRAYGKKFVPGSLHMSELWVWLTVFHAGMFAFATFSIHYFAWFMPFIALTIMRRPLNRSIGLLHFVQIVAVFIFGDLVGGPGITLGLFAPIAPDMVLAAPSLRDLLLTNPDAISQYAGLMRSVFIASMLVMMWPFMYELYSRATPAPVKSEDWPRADYIRRSRRGDRRRDRRQNKEGRRQDDVAYASARATERNVAISSDYRSSYQAASGAKAEPIPGRKGTGLAGAGEGLPGGRRSSRRSTAAGERLSDAKRSSRRSTGQSSRKRQPGDEQATSGDERGKARRSRGAAGTKGRTKQSARKRAAQRGERLRFGSSSGSSSIASNQYEPTRVVDARMERDDEKFE